MYEDDICLLGLLKIYNKKITVKVHSYRVTPLTTATHHDSNSIGQILAELAVCV